MMKGSMRIWLMMPIAAALGCSQNYSQNPPPGSLRPGEVVFVDDGTCPPGKIKRITGADRQRGVPRRVRCVKRP
jgi:hypothetical protein